MWEITYIELSMKYDLQGLNKNKRSASIRTDCKAMIRLHRRSDHSWYISRVNDTHNHRLTEAYGENKHWKSHSYIDPQHKGSHKEVKGEQHQPWKNMQYIGSNRWGIKITNEKGICEINMCKEGSGEYAR